MNGGYEPTSDQVGDTGSDNNNDDAPDLQSVSDSDWNEHRGSTSNLSGASTDSDWDERTYNPMGDVLGEAVARILESSEPYPGDANFSQHLHDRFEVVRVGDDQYQVHDRHQQIFCYLPVHMVWQPDFAPGQWYAARRSVHTGISSLRWGDNIPQLTMGNVMEQEIACTLRRGAPYSFDDEFPAISLARRFFVVFSPMDNNTFVILDRQWEIIIFLPRVMAENPAFDLATWYEDQLINELEKYRRKMKSYAYPAPDKNSRDPDDDDEGNGSASIVVVDSDQRPTRTVSPITDKSPFDACLELYGVQVPRGTYPAVQRNAAVTKDASRKVPKPVVITAKINGQPARALLDSGLLGDFMSSTIADQLKVKKDKLASPLGLQLAVQGSRSKINAGAVVEFEYRK